MHKTHNNNAAQRGLFPRGGAIVMEIFSQGVGLGHSASGFTAFVGDATGSRPVLFDKSRASESLRRAAFFFYCPRPTG